METKQEVKKTVWLWTVIGLVVGGWLGMMFAGIIGGEESGGRQQKRRQSNSDFFERAMEMEEFMHELKRTAQRR